MKKHIIGLAMLAAGCMAASAQPVIPNCSLIVNMTNGEKVTYRFALNPVATFDGGDLILTLDTEEGVVYPMDEIESFTFEDDFSGVDNIRADGGLIIDITPEYIAINGLDAGDYCRIFDMGGAMVSAANASAGGEVTLNVAGLAKGVYVVATPTHSFKFVK